MRVTCLASTDEPVVVCGIAARTCSSPDKVTKMVFEDVSWDDSDKAKFEKTLRYCLKHGHDSVFEHVSFTFLIDGVSRACTHQLVRHRIASYSQASMRKPLKRIEILNPPVFQSSKTKDVVESLYDHAVETYGELLELGVKAEDARFVLPEGTTSTIVVTMNGRELRHFIQMRDCDEAQWEIREVAQKMREIAEKQFPLLFEDFNAKSADE